MKTFVNRFNILLAIMTVFLVVSCGKKESTKTADSEVTPSSDSIVTSVTITEAQFRNAQIKLGHLGDKQLSETIKTTGSVDVPAQNYAKVSTYIGGVVKSILAQEGDYVKKGQTVITLEHPDFIKLQQEYITYKNNLLFLEKEYQRQKELFENNAGTGKVFQEVESKYNAEKGNVASLESQLSILSISTDGLDKGEVIKTIALKAPIEGFIGHLNITLGAYAEPNNTLFDITDNSQLNVHLNIFEKDVIKVSKGQKVFVTLPNQNTQEIEGEIFSIGKSVDNETKTVSVRASIKDDKHILIPGMFVNVLISVTEKSSQVISPDGIVRNGEKQYVFLATDEWCSNPIKNAPEKENIPITKMSKDSIALTYKMIEVNTGPTIAGFVGITPLEKISDGIMVVKGAYYLMSQLKSGEMVGCCEPEEKKK